MLALKRGKKDKDLQQTDDLEIFSDNIIIFINKIDHHDFDEIILQATLDSIGFCRCSCY